MATGGAGAGGSGLDWPGDPFPPKPPSNVWPAGVSAQATESGLPIQVNVPEGDTSAAMLVIGGYSVELAGPANGAITIALLTDGVLGPKACPNGGGMSGVPHNLFAADVHDILITAGKNVRFDHRRVFLEANGNNAGWGVMAGLDPTNHDYFAGIYVPWAEYNNAPCKGLSTPATPTSPDLYFVSASQCDDTYCPLKSCISTVQGFGYSVIFNDPLSPAVCDCNGACPGSIARPHFKGIGDTSGILPWMTSLLNE